MAEPENWTKGVYTVAGVIFGLFTAIFGWLIHRRKTNAEVVSITEATNRAEAQFDIEFSREVRKEIKEATRQLTEIYIKLNRSERVLRRVLAKLRDCCPDEDEYNAIEAEIDAIHGG